MSHIQIFLSLLSLLGIMHLLRLATRTKSELSVFHSAIFVSLVLYFGAIFELLPETAITVRYIGLGGAILFFLNIQNYKQFISTRFLFILLSLVVFYSLCQTKYFMTFSQVDDFGHWGKVSKHIYNTDSILAPQTYITLRDYPPIAALFHYFFTYFSGFEDRFALFAQGVLILTGLSLLIESNDSSTNLRKLGVFIVTSLTLYSLCWIFSSWFMSVSLGTLSVDTLLGISFGLILYIYFSWQSSRDFSGVWPALMVAMFVVLLKPIGILFASIAIGIILLDHLTTSRSTLASKLVTPVIATGLLMISYMSWKIYLYQNNITPSFTTQFTLTDVYQAFSKELATQRQSITIKNFINQVFFTFDRTTYWFAVCALAGGMIIILLKSKNFTTTSIINRMWIFVGFFVYLFVLLVLYIFSFSEWEGTRLASFDRYSKTYLLGMLVFLFGTIVSLRACSPSSFKINLCVITLVSLIIVPNVTYVKRDIKRVIFNHNDPSYVDNVARVAATTLKLTNPTSRVYFIYIDGSNDESNVFNYLVAPRQNNRTCSFIRPPTSPRSDTQPWFCNMSLEEFKTTLKGYDFLVLGKVSQEFIAYYLTPIGYIQSMHPSDVFVISTDASVISIRQLVN